MLNLSPHNQDIFNKLGYLHESRGGALSAAYCEVQQISESDYHLHPPLAIITVLT